MGIPLSPPSPDINYNGSTFCIFAYQSSDADFSVQHTGHSPYFINFMTGEVVLVKKWETIDSHAVLMCIAWLILIPTGIVVAMFFKHLGHVWYLLHFGLQAIAFIFVFAAFILAVQYSPTHFLNNNLSPVHACVGLAQ